MEINSLMNVSANNVAEAFNVGLIKKTFDSQEKSLDTILKMLPDGIGQNVDLLV
jgi:hypothetical protein